jgi:hypothetical protein
MQDLLEELVYHPRRLMSYEHIYLQSDQDDQSIAYTELRIAMLENNHIGIRMAVCTMRVNQRAHDNERNIWPTLRAQT